MIYEIESSVHNGTIVSFRTTKFELNRLNEVFILSGCWQMAEK